MKQGRKGLNEEKAPDFSVEYLNKNRYREEANLLFCSLPGG
jgi:hypothetical protein